MTDILSISAAHLALIEAEARLARPREACGLLIGHDAAEDGLVVTEVVPAANVAAGADRFEIDPLLLLQMHKSLRRGAARIIGHYHSHPGGPAEPSATDRASAYTPGHVWLVLGLEGERSRAAAFLHPADAPAPPERFEPLVLKIGSSA